ncbi:MULTISPECIES: ANTAR domain-containing protein [unclassified Geodermatophilus]|uniref:ANTAR domain-containing protein n=1 Tax=unclassified Geodermatophilus TaxID=2637632 RepID=UPI003EEDA1F4
MTGPADPRSAPGAELALGELHRLLLAEESPQSVLQRVVDLVRRAMPEGAEASITLVRGDRPTTAAATGPMAAELDELQYAQGHGPCLDAAVGGHLVEIADARAESRWPAYVPALLDRGALSSIAVPVPVAHLTAGLNVYAPSAGAFTDDARRAATEFAAYAGVVLTNIDTLQDARELAAHLQSAMEFRSVIEQAKGILIERHKLTPDQAFRMLADASMHSNRKARDVAEDLVRTGELPGRGAARRDRP